VTPSLWLALLVLGVCLTATVTDLRERRIPNWLTYPATVGAFVLHACYPSSGTVTEALWSAGLAAIVFFPMYWMRGIGGGDAKLALATGALLGAFTVTATFLLYTTLAGALLALLLAALKGRLKDVFLRVVSKQARKTTPPLTLAYAPAFLIGSIIHVVSLFLRVG
jgi:prepilin peptidase CpaA